MSPLKLDTCDGSALPDAIEKQKAALLKPLVTLITLGVDDLDKALAFYRDGLGLATEGIVGWEFEFGAVAFFDLQPGLRLALWPRRSLAHDTGLTEGPRSPTEFALGHNVSSKDEVDSVMRQARDAGATIARLAGDTFLGRLCGMLPGPGRASLGGRVESPMGSADLPAVLS